MVLFVRSETSHVVFVSIRQHWLRCIWTPNIVFFFRVIGKPTSRIYWRAPLCAPVDAPKTDTDRKYMFCFYSNNGAIIMTTTFFFSLYTIYHTITSTVFLFAEQNRRFSFLNWLRLRIVHRLLCVVESWNDTRRYELLCSIVWCVPLRFDVSCFVIYLFLWRC